MRWVASKGSRFVFIAPPITVIIASQEIYRRRSCFGGAVVSVVGWRWIIAVAIPVLVKPLGRIAGEGITGLVHMQTGHRVDVVGVHTAVAITVKVGIKRTLIGAPVGEDGEAWRRIVACVVQVGKTVAVSISLCLRTSVFVDFLPNTGVGAIVQWVVKPITV